MTKLIEITPESYQFIKDQFTVNGVTYGKIPSQYTKGKIANSKTKENIKSDNVYVRLGNDGKWYQTRMDKDAANINYHLNQQDIANRSNQIIDNQWRQGDGETIRVNQGDARARQQWFSNEDATKFLLTTAGLGALGIGAVSAPLATALGLAGGYAGGKAVDKGMQLGTGKTWGEWMSDKTGLPEWFSEFTNPGTIVGGAVGGYKGYKFDESFTRPLIDYTKNRGTFYAPAEYIVAHTPVGRRAIYTAMNTTERFNPIPTIKTGLGQMIKTSDGREKGKAVLKYILTGKPTNNRFKITGTEYVTLPNKNDSFYASFSDEAAGGLIFNNSSLTPKKQLIFGSGLDPKYFREVGTSDQHGVLTNYTHNLNPQYKNAKVFETNLNSKDTPIQNVKSLGTLKRDVEGQINLYDKTGKSNGWYNAGGHQIEVGITPDGLPVERSIDIYKFNPSEYANKWIKGKGQKYNKLFDFGLHTVEEATKNNVFIVRTPWYSRQNRAWYDSYGIYSK